MAHIWKNFGLKAKFTLIVGAGVLAIAASSLAVVDYFQFVTLQQNLRASAQNELDSLNALVDSAMKMRLNDPQNIAIKVFDDWFKSRNREYAGKLWSVWGPTIATYMARTTPKQPVSKPLDAVDREVLSTGLPVGRFVGNTYRYSIPIVWDVSAVTKQKICAECHGSAMGEKHGDIIAVFSSSMPVSADFVMLKQRLLGMTGAAVAAILALIFAVWWVFGRVVVRPLHALIRPFEDIAGGNFAITVPGIDRKDEIGQVARAVVTMTEKVSATIGAIKVSGREVTNASAEVAISTTDLSQRTEEQAASLEETSAAMEELSATVKKNAENAQHANESANSTMGVADRGGDVVVQAVRAMAKIEDSSRKISDIIGVIDEIARQTNLLALNAAVEAARAGEAGRGFAVVAQEVRSLAQRSSQAAKDITNLITNSNDNVKDGVELVNRAGASLNEIAASIKGVAAIVAEIANASAEQAIGIEEINRALNQMDEVTQQNSALVEENAATAKTLEDQAKAMDERVAFFQIGNTGITPLTRRAPATASKAKPTAATKAAAAPKHKPVVQFKQVADACGGNAVRKMQTDVAAAVNADTDWKEF